MPDRNDWTNLKQHLFEAIDVFVDGLVLGEVRLLAVVDVVVYIVLNGVDLEARNEDVKYWKDIPTT